MWFYDPARDTEGLLNMVVAFTDPPFCHCEIQFPDNVACSIYTGSRVVMKERTFDTANYTVVELYDAEHKIQRARQICAQMFEQRVESSVTCRCWLVFHRGKKNE